MTIDEARTHLKYTAWASRRLLDAALQLPADELHREMNVSHKSVHQTLTHIHFADRIWLARVQGAPIEQSEPIEIAWPEIHRRWQEFAGSLSDSDLARIISYKDMAGNPHETPLWQIILHHVNHATLHRGQVMAMFRQLGHAPPPTDLIFYYRERK
jgi:uncharacterized damage-inducible protein DinB